MEGLVSCEYATFFCMALTNMPFALQLLFTGCIQSGLVIYLKTFLLLLLLLLLSGTSEEHD